MNENAVGTCSLCSGLVVSSATGVRCTKCGAVPNLPTIPMRQVQPEPLVIPPVRPTEAPYVPSVPEWPTTAPYIRPLWPNGTIICGGGGGGGSTSWVAFNKGDS